MTSMAPATALDIPDGEFRRFQRFMLEETGILLADSKRALFTGRLARRLRQLGLTSYRHYYERLHTDPGERAQMFDLLLTNETSFFREPAQLEYLSSALISRWTAEADARRRRRSLRVWSAGCATGEEPFSVAMLLDERLADWSVEILATDLSTIALRQAREGMWPIGKAGDVPNALLRRYMLRGIAERAGTMKIDEALRSTVRFERINLNDPSQWPRGPFDLILCRNVLIYFAEDARRRAVDRLIARCAAGGYLFVGHAETLQGYRGLEPVRPTIWRRSNA